MGAGLRLLRALINHDRVVFENLPGVFENYSPDKWVLLDRLLQCSISKNNLNIVLPKFTSFGFVVQVRPLVEKLGQRGLPLFVIDGHGPMSPYDRIAGESWN